MFHLRSRETAIGGLLIGAISMAPLFSHAQNETDPPNTGMADPAAVIHAFDRFRSQLPDAGRTLVIPLTTLRGITSESLNSGGSVRIDMAAGSITSEVTGLPSTGVFDLWVIDNRPAHGHSTLAEPSDVMIRIGSYAAAASAHTLSATIARERLNGFFPDRAFVVRSNQSPLSSFVLTGSSTTFDRLLRWQVRFTDHPDAAIGFDPGEAASRRASFSRLTAQGRGLFLQEKFSGNGRTCGTCHVENNNFTIDPDFISALPHSDALFVAENNPSLSSLENADLMRRLGLILVNADGFENLTGKFTLRAVQSVLALGNSIAPPLLPNDVDFTNNGRNANPPQRLGWGNDGAPLRDFPIVAIVQHAPRSLNRRPGVDFRVPTDEELDALAVYQLGLGRQEDFALQTLELKSTLADSGKKLFLDTGNIGQPGRKNCNACHFNAGGTAGLSLNPQAPGFTPRLDGNPRGMNASAPTNVNETPFALDLRLPRDGGFGLLLLPTGGFGNFGDVPFLGTRPFEEHNSPPLVEAADTSPFFHNHTLKDLESAVAFYGTPAFQNSPLSIGSPLIGGPVPVKISSDPNDPEVQAIAAFLRVLNALENIRSSISVAERGRTMV